MGKVNTVGLLIYWWEKKSAFLYLKANEKSNYYLYTGILVHLQEEMCNSILEGYVEELIKSKQYSLIAYYVSKLPSPAQVHWYAQFLEGKYS